MIIGGTTLKAQANYVPQLREHRGHHLARAAPRSRKVHNARFVTLSKLMISRVILDVDELVSSYVLTERAGKNYPRQSISTEATSSQLHITTTTTNKRDTRHCISEEHTIYTLRVILIGNRIQ